ncbi:LamG-like jellyroll fold domain-containing protein [Streptomyces sp. CC228A]|uniref:LamG domain-containing protein n=1 Tax=Streptomyces sp. CC228A TaxID=2898186 RepID=UPI0035A81FFE
MRTASDARRARRRGAGRAAVLAVAAFAAVVSGTAVPAEAREQTRSASPAEQEPAGEGRRALAQAKSSGTRVEVVGERSEHTTVFANPDGSTFTLEESAVPVRVRKQGGGWEKPDATLERRTDGTVGPRAAAARIAFSGGGDTSPLASITDSGRSLALTWPGKLPEPELDGASALYREVLPDVDLKVTATPESFQHVLVVKSRKAASDKRLRVLSFGLETKGLSVSKGPAGNLDAIDATGQTVFRAPPAQMWDSSGKGGQARLQAQAPAKRAADPAAGTGVPHDASEVAASGSGLAPGQGDKVARMDVKVGKAALSVVPDAAMLAGTPDASYPLFIDPTVTWGESERTQLRSDGYVSYNWSNGSDGRGQGVGKCGSWNGYYCGPGYVQRLYYEFSPASLKGKKVLGATFRVTEPWAFQCDPRWVDLIRTDNISSATTWSSRPKELDLMVDRHVSAGRGSLCDPDSPDAPIEFRDNPEESNENLTPTVRDFAAGKFSRLTLQLRAHDESDTSAWKRFKDDAVLAVTYVALPALPAEVGLVAGSGLVCSTYENAPSVVSDPTPLVTGRPKTAAGGESGANLRIRWRTDRWNGSSWVTAHADTDSPTSGYAGNLVKQSRSLPTLSEGVKYRLKALTLSYFEDGSNRLNTGYTEPCYFKVDTTAPKAPVVTLASPYSECKPNDCVAAGGPGAKASFTFKAGGGDTNNVAYQYRLTNGDAWRDATKVCMDGIPATSCANLTESTIWVRSFRGTFTPERSGTFRLYARAKDNAGRWGAESTIDFLVAAGEAPIARWHFNEDTGPAADTSGNGTAHNAALSAGAVRDDRGRRGLITHDRHGTELAVPVTDKGLATNGTTGYAATAGPVLETRSSYTVSAWARLEDPSRTMTVLSQSGAHHGAFHLSYQPSDKTWTLRTPAKDAADGDLTDQKVAAAQPAVAGAWTHLAAVYDAEAQQISLYVNGRLQGTDAVSPAWASTGPFQIGRALVAGGYTDYWHGTVDEVAAWQRALLPAEIAQEARLLTSDAYAGVELVAAWDAAGVSGTTVADTVSGYGRALALSGGATVDREAIVFDGVDDAATIAGPLLDDTGSFTVTAAVELDSSKLLAKGVGYTGQVLGQRSADGSAWGLWFRTTGTRTVVDAETLEERTVPVGFWHFGRLDADGTFSSVASDEEAALDSLVRVTGVHDAQTGTISLYLGHNANGAPTAYTARLGAGEFALAKGHTSGGGQQHLPARIADVRLWSGAMAGSEQIGTHVGD